MDLRLEVNLGSKAVHFVSDNSDKESFFLSRIP